MSGSRQSLAQQRRDARRSSKRSCQSKHLPFGENHWRSEQKTTPLRADPPANGRLRRVLYPDAEPADVYTTLTMPSGARSNSLRSAGHVSKPLRPFCTIGTAAGLPDGMASIESFAVKR